MRIHNCCRYGRAFRNCCICQYHNPNIRSNTPKRDRRRSGTNIASFRYVRCHPYFSAGPAIKLRIIQAARTGKFEEYDKSISRFRAISLVVMWFCCSCPESLFWKWLICALQVGDADGLTMHSPESPSLSNSSALFITCVTIVTMTWLSSDKNDAGSSLFG